ncbi:hypothetical protein SS1G_12795 [Sclerotinia sclerotiorum 1980 UF-70]|uniref:4-alpha-glucanotransferase n=1 Tax=Sclerotinia sclerotiorum (strain ATCC 18683 / 1980 / Ss-1) TaxID=665079 RepID=A7F5B8_SCLS1|nr:hypothetical protein SS1G_12795 [Sclerotinia sclerotiorum 1980 UF-70]EDN97939.1 hypothetical protein SS1G_12795 [Sclerotinia sclerotiorum 1980 UF-70]
MVSNEVYLLPLKDDGSPDVSGGYIYLTPKGTEPIIVRFAIEGTSSICREGSLWVNIPEKGAEFQRDQFREFKLEPDFNRTIEISIPIHSAGAFAFYTTYKALPDLDNTNTATIETTKSPVKDLANHGLPTTLDSVDDLVKVMAGVKTEVIAKLRLWEYYVIEIERDADAVVEAWAANKISFPEGGFGGSGFGGLEAIKNASVADQATFLREKGMLNTDRLGERYRRMVNPKVGAALLTALFGRFEGDKSNSADRAEARSRLVNILDEVNLPYYKEYDVDVAEILDQLFNRTKYVRLDDNGPKLGPIDEKNPLIETYFTRLPKNSTTSKHNQEDLALVNNGWIWAANALVDNAGPKSRAYLRREAWSTGEVSRLVHRHGGRPIGSFEVDEVSGADQKTPNGKTNGSTSGREIIRTIRYTPVHALFMDCTHDNEVPAQKRDARDTLPNAALVAMCSSAIGSVMGYDEIYPKLVEIVHETRLYTSASSEKEVKIGAGEGGIGGIKKLLNQIHSIMGKDGYAETYIHHEDQYITVHRVHPESRKGYFLIAHTAFPGYGNGNGGFKPVHLGGTKASHLGSWMLEVDTSDEAKKEALGDKKYLRGLPSKVSNLPGVRMEYKDGETTISVRDKFPPGSIALFETWIPAAEHATGLDNFVTSGAKAAFSELDLIDLNFVLYRCEPEERDSSEGKDGVYDIPGHGKLVYAGLQGWWSVLKNIIKDNNLGHPMCNHLREGQWALDYIIGRLERISSKSGYERVQKPAMWLKERFDAIRKMPSFLLPRYFGLVIRTAYRAAWERSLSLMNKNVREGQWFLQDLAMIIRRLCQMGLDLLKEKVPRRFLPYDDTYFDSDDARAYSKTSILEDIIQESLQRHASGMSFREANAGPNLDMQMSSEGFNIDIKVDWSTGLIFGGNQNNCGTWMDKMGESERAKSKGVPGTPRDGAAIEITGLLYSTLRWVAELHEKGKYKYAGVSTSDPSMQVITFSDWANKIKENFERCYYVPLDSKDDAKYDVNTSIVNRRGIYKDLYKSGKEYEDYQLRANFPIAMTVAPELFDDTHALNALFLADKVLRGPTGMATLDPADLNYRPYYINSEDSDDFATSKGRNYHQGPEWLWPTGFFLRALLKFDLKRRKTPAAKTEAFQQITRRLAGCKEAIVSSDWAGLTELTNKDGSYCADSVYCIL